MEDQPAVHDLSSQTSIAAEFPHWTDRLFGIFSRPVDTLKYVFEHPSFKLPHLLFLFLIVSSLVFAYTSASFRNMGMGLGSSSFMTAYLGVNNYVSWLMYGSISWLLMKAFKCPVTLKGTMGAYAHAVIPLISWYLLLLLFGGGAIFVSEIMSFNIDAIATIFFYLIFSKLGWLINMIWIIFFFKAAGLSNGKSILLVIFIWIIKTGLFYLSITVLSGHLF